MTTAITKSVLDNNRFELLAGGKNNKNKVATLDLNNRDKREKPKIILDYSIELNSGLTENKLNTRQVYNMYPYKKLSIEL